MQILIVLSALDLEASRLILGNWLKFDKNGPRVWVHLFVKMTQDGNFNNTIEFKMSL